MEKEEEEKKKRRRRRRRRRRKNEQKRKKKKKSSKIQNFPRKLLPSKYLGGMAATQIVTVIHEESLFLKGSTKFANRIQQVRSQGKTENNH